MLLNFCKYLHQVTVNPSDYRLWLNTFIWLFLSKVPFGSIGTFFLSLPFLLSINGSNDFKSTSNHANEVRTMRSNLQQKFTCNKGIRKFLQFIAFGHIQHVNFYLILYLHRIANKANPFVKKKNFWAEQYTLQCNIIMCMFFSLFGVPKIKAKFLCDGVNCLKCNEENKIFCLAYVCKASTP